MGQLRVSEVMRDEGWWSQGMGVSGVTLGFKMEPINPNEFQHNHPQYPEQVEQMMQNIPLEMYPK